MNLTHLVLCAAYLSAGIAFGQGPHEVMLLVNAKSSGSVEIAESWAKRRGVPKQNVVRLELPQKYADGEIGISPDEFTKLIWDPAVMVMKERGLGHVLAWVYSSDFPVVVTEAPVVSTLGLTFLKNRWPEERDVRNARYKSMLFAGRDSALGTVHFPQSLISFKRWLADDMPLPCMMLGYTGRFGNTKNEVLECLERGASSDGGKMTGTVYFVETDDIRSDVREWQFPLVKRELGMMGVNCVITNSMPVGQKNIMGLVMGSPSFDISVGNSYEPGAMAENLTSAGAVFSSGGQTKITKWISAGTTATSGAVTEPYAIWAKFPDARFYVYYASGCTMLESYFQSIRCPLQLLIIGDPLACPWSEPAEIFLSGAEGVAGVESAELSVEVKSGGLDHYGRVLFMVDGRIVARGTGMTLAAADYNDGAHVLRIVVYRTGMVQNQAFREYEFSVDGTRLSFGR